MSHSTSPAVDPPQQQATTPTTTTATATAADTRAPSTAPPSKSPTAASSSAASTPTPANSILAPVRADPASTSTTASSSPSTSSTTHPATVSDPTAEDVDMAVPVVSHPTLGFAASDAASPLKVGVSPAAPATTLPPNLPLLGDLLPEQAQQQHQPFGAGLATGAAFRPASSTPQPFQASKVSPPTPSTVVNPTEVTSASATPAPTPSAAAAASASTSTPATAKMAPVVAGMGTLPPTVSAASGSNAAASASGSTSNFSASDSLRAIPTNKNNPAFLNKLRSMVDDPNTDELIRWAPDGASFFVPNHVRFGDEVLPRFFKHNRFSSFVRQLNMYGFHKVPHLQQGALKHDSPQESELWEFSNPNFHRDHPDWLSKVQRKKGPRDDKDHEREASASTGQELMHAGALMRTDFGASSDANGDGALQLASVLNAINAIKNAQTSISADLRHLQNSNQNLWQEAVESRQRAKRQQETINKILRFLAGVFGNQDDAEAPVPGKKVSGKGARGGGGGGRRVGVRPQPQQRGKSRLMIEDGTASSSGLRGLEGLDLPLDQEEVEEMPSHLRFQDASNGDSPKGASPSANNGGSRFTQIGSPPSSSSAAEFGRQLSEAVSTPGGSRRLSSHASNQVLNALASGEGNAWLASLFGASLANQGSKSTGPASGGGLKLDPHMVAALQQALASAGGGGAGGAGAGVNGVSDNGGDYFGAGNNGQQDDFSSRFSTFPAGSNDSSTGSSGRSSSGGGGASGQQSSAANGLGLDADALARIAGISQALIQSPARQNLGAGGSNNSYSVTSPSKGSAAAGLFDAGVDDAANSGSSNNQQLALSLSRATRDLQNTSSDVDQVQNSINSLIEGLQANPNLLQSVAGQSGTAPAQPNAGATGAAAPWQSADFGSVNAFDAGALGGPSGTTPPSATSAAAGAVDTDFDVDSFLSQFVDSSQAPGGGVTSPSNAYGESPSFAFSPATTAAFLHGAGASDAAGIYAQEVGSGSNSGASTASGNSPTGAGGGAGKKRKPSMEGGGASRPVKKSASRKA